MPDRAGAKPYVDPQILRLLEIVDPAPIVSVDATNLDALRASRRAAHEGVDVPSGVLRCEQIVRDSAGSQLTLRIHRPRHATAPAPAIYTMHGGGFVLGSAAMDDARLGRWCRDVGIVGISVDYSLSPEASFPRALEDCGAGLEWTFDNAAALGINPDRVGVCGISAGGALAAGLSLMWRDTKRHPLAFQLLIYPMLDDRQSTESSRWDAPVWAPSSTAFAWHCYLGEKHDGPDVPAYAAPGRGKRYDGLPPTFIGVGGADCFCGEDIDFARRLVDAGVPIDLHVYSGAPHSVDTYFPESRLAARLSRDIEEWLTTWACSGPSPQDVNRSREDS